MNNSKYFLIFSIDDRRYALPVSAVERVIHAVEITTIPDSPDIMSGIINIEGGILSVISLRRCFQMPDRGIRKSDRFIIVRKDLLKLALITDSVYDILNILQDDIVESEKLFEGLSQTTGAIRREDGIIPVIGIDHLFSIHYGKLFNENTECEQAME